MIPLDDDVRKFKEDLKTEGLWSVDIVSWILWRIYEDPHQPIDGVDWLERHRELDLSHD